MLSRRDFLINGSALVATALGAPSVLGASLPGTGITVTPTGTSTPTTRFQSLVVELGLQRLGYTVKDYVPADPAIFHMAIASGDATFSAVEWVPLYDDYYSKVGGDTTCVRMGSLINDCIFGYSIDKKTADKYQITNLAQFKDEKIAKLFNTNGMDRKASLVAGNPGWGAAKMMQHHLELYGLKNSIQLQFGNYDALMADVLTRIKSNQPVFYYSWLPNWISNVLKPGVDVSWLSVPFADPANGKNMSKLPDGRDTGFPVYTVKVLGNKGFIDKNPAAKKLFEVANISTADISAENMLMQQGQNKPVDIRRRAEDWVKAHQSQFDQWIAQAMQAA
ncbi:L-proline glycine betaine binding ABC transporter protein ProX [Candidatus Burkholderia verschuerenii]|uniref:L-proline glycine betaine binding ABC transporter protein ProX n=1 Tax=Candidatus Burkholderia verschuerenii TaxID=242163 RepID=A0A0L0M759_9BURK|nr:glycine betaine/L-proline ABC transporter substrate-binding protein ProX [Candidatus Burkholderia verschuerenii]KND57814.1 L-proline glycine betaine binding ABC transporter protein ProX [Candidatus Burkholderia verschuerenii]